MKKLFILFLVISQIQCMNSQDLKNNNDSVSYSFGILIAQQLKSQGMTDLSPEAIAKGIGDVLAGKDTEVDVNQANTLYQEYAQKKKEEASVGLIEEGKKFLEENAKRPKVKTTASGLQYEVIKSGTGKSPAPTDKVTTHYHGTLIDGTVFDSSVDRGEPATFPVNGVIQGWQEALPMMKEGDKWKLYIPYNLAYGERGAGGKIKPYSALIFEIELIKVGE